MKSKHLQIAVVAGLSLLASGSVLAVEAKVLAINPDCELAVVQKTGEYGLVTVFTHNAISIGDVLNGDFESIKYMRKARNENTGKDIMIRGVRYSSSRRIVESEIPPECKFPEAAAATQKPVAPAQ